MSAPLSFTSGSSLTSDSSFYASLRSLLRSRDPPHPPCPLVSTEGVQLITGIPLFRKLLFRNPTCITWLEHLLQCSLFAVSKQHPEVWGCSRGLGALPRVQGCSPTFCHHPPARPARCLPHLARSPGGPAEFCSARRSVADAHSLSPSCLSKACRRKTACRARLRGRDSSRDVRSSSFVTCGPPEARTGLSAPVCSRVLRGKCRF